MQVPIELKIKYLSRRVQDLQRLSKSLEAGDYSLAMRLGHQVKGNAVTFDVPQMAHLGGEMEKAAQVKDKSELEILVKKMESIIQSAQNTIQI